MMASIQTKSKFLEHINTIYFISFLVFDLQRITIMFVSNHL